MSAPHEAVDVVQYLLHTGAATDLARAMGESFAQGFAAERDRVTAPDHALVLYALTCGAARWDSKRGDLFVGEQPFATTIDEFGCPKVSPVMRDALVLATGGRR